MSHSLAKSYVVYQTNAPELGLIPRCRMKSRVLRVVGKAVPLMGQR